MFLSKIRTSTKCRIALAVLCILLLLSGCGASYSGYKSADTAPAERAVNSFAPEASLSSDSYYGGEYYEEDAAAAADYAQSKTSDTNAAEGTVMIAKTADIEIDVDDLSGFDAELRDLVDAQNGYFASTDVWDYDNEYSASREGEYNAKIPADKLDAFLAALEEKGVVQRKVVSTDDVSLEYVDNEAKIKTLEDAKTSLERLLLEADSTEDVMNIMDRISDIQYQLDSAKGRKRYLEGRVEYSNVHITAIEEREVEHRILGAFSINFKERFAQMVEDSVGLFAGIVFCIPQIVIIGFFVVLALLIIKKIFLKIFSKERRAAGRKNVKRKNNVKMPVANKPLAVSEAADEKKEPNESENLNK